MQIAVVADIHLHDLYGGYGLVEKGSGELALRTLVDTMASTRVFNESHAAFLAVLDDIVQHGIRDVVLLGDYSDDGQPGAVDGVKAILSSYENMYGLRFFTTFGNHDSFGPQPLHQGKHLTAADGLNPVWVSSDGGVSQHTVVCSAMQGMSTLEAMNAMAPYGVDRPENVLHWETPFGDCPRLDERRLRGDAAAGLDASYLVEPQDGLWLLLLDANHFELVDDHWQLKADAAWDHIIENRDYLIDWIEDVARRATASRKTLLAFSHYPALPLAFTRTDGEISAACTPDWQKRMPSPESSRRLAAAGLKWHFSGHMHIAGKVEHSGLVNVAVPSPVAYPGGYVVVSGDSDEIVVETVRLGIVQGFDVAFHAYHAQSLECEGNRFLPSPVAKTYPEFLLAHLQNLIVAKHLPNDWPTEFLANLGEPIEKVLGGAALAIGVFEKWPQVASLPLRTMVEDYYLFRAAGQLAADDVPSDRIGFYNDLRDAIGAPTIAATGVVFDSGFLRLFFACWQ